jgi:hypothetical protein
MNAVEVCGVAPLPLSLDGGTATLHEYTSPPRVRNRARSSHTAMPRSFTLARTGSTKGVSTRVASPPAVSRGVGRAGEAGVAARESDPRPPLRDPARKGAGMEGVECAADSRPSWAEGGREGPARDTAPHSHTRVPGDLRHLAEEGPAVQSGGGGGGCRNGDSNGAGTGAGEGGEREGRGWRW